MNWWNPRDNGVGSYKMTVWNPRDNGVGSYKMTVWNARGNGGCVVRDGGVVGLGCRSRSCRMKQRVVRVTGVI